MRRRLVNVVFILVLMSLPGCRQASAPVAVPPEVQGLTLVAVHQAAVPSLSVVSATVRAEQVARLASRTMGVVERVEVQAGQRVAAGQLLLTIEANDAAARLAAARSAVDSARERLDLAEITWRRYQGLYARSAVSRQDYD